MYGYSFQRTNGKMGKGFMISVNNHGDKCHCLLYKQKNSEYAEYSLFFMT